MSRLLYDIWNLSAAASLTMLVVLMVRLLLRRAPKKYSVLLWVAVFTRAVFPGGFHSTMSLFRIFPFMMTESGQMKVALREYQAAGLRMILEPSGVGMAGVTGAVHPGTPSGGAASQAAAPGGMSLGELLTVIWIAGMAVLLAYGIFSWLRLRRRVAFAVRTEDGSYETDQIPTAFVLGFFRPRIYVPSGLSVQERAMVLAHEQAHLRWLDPQLKFLAWMITVMHWFNPCMWLSFILLVRDMELACDERVLEHLGEKEKKAYGNCLLSLASPKRFPSGTPLAFGESSIKVRIRSILRYRKGSVPAGMLALGTVLITLAACLSNPEETAMRFVSEWAEAVASRDADKVYGMLSPELQSKAEELGIETAENGQRVMGWSSPFVPGNIAPVVVLGSTGKEKTAEITYPAMTSDPLWWVWKDEITFEPEGDSFRVTRWEGRDYFTISSLEEFMEAYGSWFPDYQLADETGKSFAEYLQAHYQEEINPDSYQNYFSPDRAAESTLHLSGGMATVTNERDGEAVVNYQWEDGSLQIDMVQPITTGKGGVWVPVGWSAENFGE